MLTVAAASAAFVLMMTIPTPAVAQAGKAAPKADAPAKAATPATAAPGAFKTTYKSARMDDKSKAPNIQGIWTVGGWDTSRYSLEWHNGATGIRPGKGSIVDPADGIIPYTPAARQKQQANFKNRAKEDPMNKCFMSGVPRFVTGGYPFQIFETPKYIILASEYTHMLRYVYMERKDHQYDGALDFWNGDSLGHWEGETLVIDTTANNNQTWYDMSGNFHSDKLHVVERLTRSGLDTMNYSATMTDPETLTRPFTINLTLHRNTDKYPELMEYECHAYRDDDIAAGQ
jgi:hypothetical protein